MSHRRSPRPLGLALEHDRERWTPATPLAEIQAVWADAVGAAIAAQARPRSERGGVLTVSCSAAVWAQELDLCSAMVLERLHELAPGAPVKRLRCVCG
jgi:predicted nucleic acid-binding Zn ribbon protein